jgi:putative ABC transport system permease protein
MISRLGTTIAEFLKDLRAQKLRTFLTIFGIVWGTVAIVVLLAFGMGFKRQLAINMHGIGEKIVIMFPGATTKPYAGFGIGRPITLIEDDARYLAEKVKDINKISPEYSSHETSLRVGQNIINSLVAGVYPIYGEMRNIFPSPGGRFIDDQDLRDHRRVALIGDNVKDLLFGETDPIGKIIYLGETPFTVVGVMQKKVQNSSYNRQDRDRVFIPASTFTAVFGSTYINNIIYTPVDARRADETDTEVREALADRYRFDPTDRDAVYLWDTTEIDKFMFYFFLAFNIFMGVIGSFTLAVGGLGVANIMFIVVQERVKEIGIKRAVGARRSNILGQFFIETFFIILLGSSVGFAIAAGITKAMQYIPIKDFVGTPEISLEVGVATVLVLGIIGLAAGYMPARRAANLNIVDCLRA